MYSLVVCTTLERVVAIVRRVYELVANSTTTRTVIVSIVHIHTYKKAFSSLDIGTKKEYEYFPIHTVCIHESKYNYLMHTSRTYYSYFRVV